MKVKITAGTHIGIVGGYGEKNITIPGENPDSEVKAYVFNAFKSYMKNLAGFQSDQRGNNTFNTFFDKTGCTIIEYYYEVMNGKDI